MSYSCKNYECVTEGVAAPLVKFPIKLKSENSHNIQSNCYTQKKNSKTNAKKISNVDEKTKLVTFLDQFLVEKDLESTHTSLSGECYKIPDQFLKTLHKCLAESNEPIHLSEKHPDHVSAICIDFDFRQKNQPSTRIFDLELISKVVKLYNWGDSPHNPPFYLSGLEERGAMGGIPPTLSRKWLFGSKIRPI